MYLALTTVAFSQPLLQLYGSNLAVFTSAHYSGPIVVWFSMLVLLAPASTLLAIDLLLTRVSGLPVGKVHVGLVWVGAWPVVSMLLRNVTVGPWLVDALMTFVIAGLAARLYSRQHAVRSWLSWVSLVSVPVVALFVQSAMPVIAPPAAEAVSAESSVGRPSSSIVWIVLDEAPLFPLLDQDGNVNSNRFPGLAELAADSTWYRNVVATSQKTTDAVPAMLTGMWPSGGQPVLGDHPRNLFTALGTSMTMDVSESVTAMCPSDLCAPGSRNTSSDGAGLTEQHVGRIPFLSFLRDASVVVGHKILPRGLRGRLPSIDEGWGEFGAGNDKDGQTAPAVAGEVRTGHAGRVQTLENLIGNAVSAPEPTLHFAHVLLPHKPWTLAPDLRMSARPDNDPRPVTSVDRRRDAYQSHLRQYVAVDSVIGDLVRKLKASGNWEKTMVVVTADHGLTFVPGESYRDKVNVKNPPTLDDIYRVPLFVKFPGRGTGVVTDCPVSSVDILPTVLAAAGVKTGWEFDGVDVGSRCPERTSRTVRWPKGRYDLRTGVPELMERVAYYSTWVKADGDVDDIVRSGLSGSLVGTRVPSAPSRETGLRWTLANRSAFSGVGAGEFAPVPTRAFGTLTATTGFGRSTEALVEVDGLFAGVVSELAGLRKGKSTYFSAPVQTSLIGAGNHEVRLWTATWADGMPTLRLVG